MRRLYVGDQRDRGVPMADGGGAVKASDPQKAQADIGNDARSANDKKRRDQVREMLSAGRVTTAQDFHDAAFIFQHGESASDFLLAHILAVEAVVKGDNSSKWIAAATLDRYLQTIGQKQVFGTQYVNEGYAFYLAHQSEVNDVDFAQKVKAAGSKTTQQPYDSSLIPDTLRLDFCVLDTAQQSNNVQEFNDGKSPRRMIPDGCTR